MKSAEGTFPRNEFELYFGSAKIPNKTDAYKIYFVDSCRGNDESVAILKENQRDFMDTFVVAGGPNVHAATNTAIIYSNSNTFRSYEVPYNKEMDDIQELNINSYMSLSDGLHCGIFMNAVVKTLSMK